ncbi:MAG: IS4 family transposase [Bdellovibrionales bacterium]|nr:IS4 family transposase [Bdellovibrionales bacterium]
MTNLEVKTVTSALEKVRWYGLRWKIEEYFRILKSGCSIEKCRLISADKLIKMIALTCVIAFKLMYLSKAALSQPDEDCSKVLSQQEWQTLYFREKKTRKIPKNPPSIKEAMIWLGKLGGFLNRKGDKLPGTMVLWRGYEILQENIAMYFALRAQFCG